MAPLLANPHPHKNLTPPKTIATPPDFHPEKLLSGLRVFGYHEV